MVKLGLFLTAQFDPASDIRQGVEHVAAQARDAERYGFDALFLGHHYLAHSAFMQPLPLLGYLAAQTSRVELGLGVHLAPLANPLALAEDLATIDALSGGRLIIGVGSGYRAREYDALGVPYADRFKRLELNTSILRRLLAGEEVGGEFPFGTLDRAKVHLRGRPVGQSPDIWMGAFGEIGLKRAARLDCSWLAPPDGDEDEQAARFDQYRAFLAEAGKSVDRAYPLMREVVVASTNERAREIAREHMARQYQQYKQWQAAQDASIDDLLDRFAIVGDPERVTAKMRSLTERLGLTHLLARVQWAGMPHEDATAAIRLMGEEVIPALKA
ncbi:MAG: LLM class flavin-dependent oxidoreductase [Sphingobium sp.]|jgi:alkanesulfonate monooxygenase SsuD/methylene tetrahydromethanopterin reductase-like flavin-dependent oxidoreductase (luciferase family)